MKFAFLVLPACLLLSLFAKAQNEPQQQPAPPPVYTYVEQMPVPGYDMGKYLGGQLHYPDSAANNNIQGRVVVRFIVNEDGSISDCKVVKGIGGGCDEEAVRALKAMPKWKAGMNNGKAVKVWFTLPVSFTLRQAEQAYSYVDQMPRPDYDLRKFITGYLPYVDSTRKNDQSGYVIVKVVVNEDGKISNARVIQGIGGGCDEEALAVVKNIPPFRPGKQNGKPVKVYYTLPVTFKSKLDSRILNNAEDSMSTSKLLTGDATTHVRDTSAKYLQKDLHYPEYARDHNIQGQVVVGFVVNEDGSISDCSVLKGIGGGCDEEAIRVIRNMPRWKPGLKDGKPVKVYFTQPTTFNLE